jgi:hypothetical protein
MPFRSGNIFNPRAYQYFHPVGKYKMLNFYSFINFYRIKIGSTAPRLTQAPSILKFPSLPSRSVSIYCLIIF